MDAPQEEFYSKPEDEVWVAFNCHGPRTKNLIQHECSAWGSCVTLEAVRSGCVVLVARSGGARELA